MNALVSQVLGLRCVLPCPMCPISLFRLRDQPRLALNLWLSSCIDLSCAGLTTGITTLSFVSFFFITPHQHFICTAQCMMVWLWAQVPCGTWRSKRWMAAVFLKLSTLFLRQILSPTWSSLIWLAGWPVNFPDLPASVLSTLEAAHSATAPRFYVTAENLTDEATSPASNFSLTLNNFITHQPLHVASQMSHHWLQLHWPSSKKNAEHTFLFKSHYSYLHFGPAFSPTFKKFS